jgi:hypothetical protein
MPVRTVIPDGNVILVPFKSNLVVVVEGDELVARR